MLIDTYRFLNSPISITEQKWPDDVVPYVHVWIQAFNHEKYISTAIESVLSQKTTFPVKILIHDDASNDNTPNIIKEYEIKYPRLIKAYYQKTNSFSHENSHLKNEFNTWKTGKYEANCEGDDYWSESLKLQMQVDFLEKNQLDLIYTDLDILYEKDNKLVTNAFKNEVLKDFKNADDFIINCGYKAPCTWLYKKDIIDEISSKDFHSVDPSFFVMSYALLNKKVGFLNNSTAVYRVLENSLTNTNSLLKKYNREKELLIIQKHFTHYFDSTFIDKLERAAFVRLFFMELALFPTAFDTFLIEYYNCVRTFSPKTKREYLINIIIPFHKLFSYPTRLFFLFKKYKF